MGAKFQETTSKLLDVMRRTWLKKHGVPLPAPTMTAQQRAEIQECFEMLDRDGSGALDVKEIIHAFGALGFTISKDAISELMLEADPDGSGELEFDEFLSLMGRALYQPDERGMALVAKTGSGDLSFADVVRAFRRKKLIESLILGGDARLKVVEFHERVQEMIRAETETSRQRENAQAIFATVKAEREKAKLMAPSSQRSLVVNAKMRSAIGRSLNAFESLYSRHQSQSQTQIGDTDDAMKLQRPSTSPYGGASGSDGGVSVSGGARCCSPGVARGVTFVTELQSEPSGGSLDGLDLRGTRRPRPHSDHIRRPVRSASTAVLSKATSHKVSIAVLKYLKHLEDQTRKQEKKFNDAARMNASLIQPLPDRSEFSQIIQQSSRPGGHRSGQATVSHNSASASICTNGAGTSSSDVSPGSGAGTASVTSLSGGVRSVHNHRLFCGIVAAASTVQREPSVDVSCIRAESSINAGSEGAVLGMGGLEPYHALAPHQQPTYPPPLPTPPSQQQQQHQRLVVDGSVIRPYLEPAQEGQFNYEAPTTAASADFMATAAKMNAGNAFGAGGAPPLPPPPMPVQINTTVMASRAWRQAPSPGPANSMLSPLGWGSGVGASSVHRGGGAGGTGGAGSGGGSSAASGQALNHSRSIAATVSLAADSALGGDMVPPSSASVSDMGLSCDGRQVASRRGASGRATYCKRPSSSDFMALPPLPLSPRAASATPIPGDASMIPRSRSASPPPQPLPNHASALCASGVAAITAASVANWTTQATTTTSLEPQGIAATGFVGVPPDVQPSRSTVVSAGVPGGGGIMNCGNGLALHAPGPLTRAWLAHARSVPQSGTALRQRSFRQAPTNSARRQTSISSNGMLSQSVSMAGGGAAVATNATTNGAPGNAAAKLGGYSHGPVRVASRSPGGMGSAVGSAAEGLMEGIVNVGPPPGLTTPLSAPVASAGQHGGGASDGKLRELCSRHSRLGPRFLTSDMEVGSGISSASRSHCDAGTGGSDNLLSSSGAAALRTARSDYDSEADGSRGPTIEGSPGSGDGSGGSGSSSSSLPRRRFPLAKGFLEAVVVATSANTPGSTTLDAVAAVSVAEDERKVEVPAMLQDAAALGDASAFETGDTASAAATAAAAAVAANGAGSALAADSNSTALVAPLSMVANHTTTQMSIATKVNGHDSIQSSAPSGSSPTSPRYPANLRSVTNTGDSSSSSSVRGRNSSGDGSSYAPPVMSPLSTAAVTTAAAAISSPPAHSTHSISGGGAIVISNNSPVPPQTPAANTATPFVSPMRSRGNSGAATATVVVVPPAFAPRGAYISLQLASQRNGAATGGARSPRRGPGESGGAGGCPARPAAALKPSTPAEPLPPPPSRTPPLQDRVVATFFGQTLPRARNGAVMLPAMGLPPQSYPPEFQHHSGNGMHGGIPPQSGRALTPSYPRGWTAGGGAATALTTASGGTTHNPMAAIAAATSASLTTPGAPAGWPSGPGSASAHGNMATRS